MTVLGVSILKAYPICVIAENKRACFLSSFIVSFLNKSNSGSVVAEMRERWRCRNRQGYALLERYPFNDAT